MALRPGGLRSSAPPHPVEPGWYRAPHDDTVVCFWDGRAWTQRLPSMRRAEPSQGCDPDDDDRPGVCC